MQHASVLVAVFGVLVTACELPTTPPPLTITQPFRVQVQNASQPSVHNKFMNLLPAGGGDQHLFIGPVGDLTYDLTLVQGVIEHNGKGVRAVIGGEFSEIDDTTKMFMTGRGDPRAIYTPVYACNPTTDALQIQLNFVTWQNHPPGGWICVRPTFDNSHEFRYYPPGNAKVDPNRTCIKVTLVVVPSTGNGVSSSASPSSTSTAVAVSSSTTSSFTTSTISVVSTATSSSTFSSVTPPASSSTSLTPLSSTTTSTTAGNTPSPLPFTDMTANGFAFIGCAPEERKANDGPFRTLSGALYADQLMTNEKCMAYCQTRGFKYAGTEYSRECWCGNSYAVTRQPGTTKASLAGCSYACGGNANQKCGGADWLSLYKACAVGTPCLNAVFT